MSSSPAAGGCVLLVLLAAVFAVVFAVSPTAGVLTVWGAGTAALWRAARRRMSDSSATPPPEGAAPLGDVYAGGTEEVDRVTYGPGEGRMTIHVARQEVTK